MSSNIEVQRICQHCGIEFTARTTVTMYCSNKCSKAANKAKIRAAKIAVSNNETQRIKNKTIDELKAKPFLSIAEACKLIGISRRTIYRMIERGELIAGKAGTRTILRRSDFDVLFEQPSQSKPPQESNPLPVKYEIEESYTVGEVQGKFGISESALNNVIKRNSIPKFQKGKFVYIPKVLIDKLLG